MPPYLFWGLACAVGVSSIYYNQPLLLEMSHTYGATVGRTGFVAVETQVGYAFGMLMFVPLGDVVERRGLMMKMYAAAAISLLLVAVAPTLDWLIAGSFVMGMLASVTHVVVPIAPDLVSDKERGRAIGMVMTGLLLGILLARTFAGWVSRIHGWRYVFVVAAVMNAAFVPLLWRVMPKLPPKQTLGYREAMISLWTLFRTEPLLRGELRHRCAGVCFLQLLLDDAGLLARRSLRDGGGSGGDIWAGWSGRGTGGLGCGANGGSAWIAVGGCVRHHNACGLLCAVVERRTADDIDGVACGVAGDRGDCAGYGCSNDPGGEPDTNFWFGSISAEPDQYGVHDDVLWRGGGVGSALATVAWVHWGWNGVCILALGLIALAGLVHATGIRDRDNPRHQAARQDELMKA